MLFSAISKIEAGTSFIKVSLAEPFKVLLPRNFSPEQSLSFSNGSELQPIP